MSMSSAVMSVDSGFRLCLLNSFFLFFSFLLPCPTLHSRGHQVNEMLPVFQSISGLCFFNHVIPKIKHVFPKFTTSNVHRLRCPFTVIQRSTSCVIEPALFSMPSTL